MVFPQLPQPPTDNLYKFKAIGGLVIIIVSVLVPAIWAYNFLLTIEENRAKANLLETELIAFWDDFFLDHVLVTPEMLEKEPDFLNKQLQKLRQLKGSGEKADFIGKRPMRPMNPEELKKFQDVTRDFAIREAQLNNDDNKASLFKVLFIFFFLIPLSFGVSTMRKGFKDWYHKLQKYQDLIIRNQAKDSVKNKHKNNPEE